MVNLLDDIRKQMRESHRKKKEEERRAQEQQRRRAQETLQRPSSNPPSGGSISFASKTVDASPLSDVTCSQSPSKAAASKRSVVFTKPEPPKDDNDSDPIMALARQTLAEKETKPKAKVEDSPSVASGSSIQKEDAKDDPVEIQRRLSREKELDPLEIARTRDQEKKRVKQEEQDSDSDEEQQSPPKYSAKNPLALMERNNRERTSLSPEAANNDGWPARAAAADLWDDDSEDEVKRVPNQNKKPAAPRKKNGEARKAPPKKKKKGNAKAASRRQSYEDIDDIDSDSEREEALIPTLDNPKLGPPGPLEPLQLKAKDQKVGHEVPASINRYLRGYQQHGVAFLYSCIMRDSGCILGDDMGLGKTVQLISLLASLLGKTGTGKDGTDLHRRKRLISEKLREIEAANDDALLTGARLASSDTVDLEGVNTSEWVPVLVIVPPSVIDNWMKEFCTWGHFGVGKYQNQGRHQALAKVKNGTHEILVCGGKLATLDFNELSSVQWKLIIVDEVHAYKNDKSKAYKGLRDLRDLSDCPIIGMTGTIMPNNHRELYNLIDLVAPDHLGDWETFKKRFSQPIKYARTKTADQETIQQSVSCHHELEAKLKTVYIARTKEAELGDELPEKDETVLFCAPTEIQKKLYLSLLNMPDYELLRYANAPCDCGVNRGIFMGYKQMRSTKERIEYQRRHKQDIVPRKKCCYPTPENPGRGDDGQPSILPDAVLWRAQHPDDEQCIKCPYCIQFPAYTKLYKLSSHAALLLAERDPSSFAQGSDGWTRATKDVAFAKAAIPSDILSELPGSDTNPYVRQDGIMSDHAKMSGKMEKLDRLLRAFDNGVNRVLLFSHYVKTLDLIQQFVQARGCYTYLRLDGSTSTPDRQKIVDKFQTDPTIFLLLMSTKAGGLGLNLTAANKVICFDLDFNPSHDEQAQDRAYRIGQEKNVQVIRLISQGTIEEQKYIRQIYKTHLKNDTIKDAQESKQTRIFRGVEGDKDRKGEVFGVENLLKFKQDGSFMGDLWKSSEKSKKTRKDETIKVDDLAASLANLTGEDVENIGGSALDEDFHLAATSEAAANGQQDFLTADRGGVARRQSDDRANGTDAAQLPDDEDEGNINVAKAAGVAHSLKHQDLFDADRGNAPEERDGDDEYMEAELGGESQAIKSMLDRERDDEDDSDSAPNEASPPKAASPPKEQARTDNVQPKKRRFAGGGSAFAASLETIDEDSQSDNAMDYFPGEQECIESSGREPKKTKKRPAPKSKKEDENAETSFSTQDIALPTYRKKKKKKKSKK